MKRLLTKCPGIFYQEEFGFTTATGLHVVDLVVYKVLNSAANSKSPEQSICQLVLKEDLVQLLKIAMVNYYKMHDFFLS